MNCIGDDMTKRHKNEYDDAYEESLQDFMPDESNAKGAKKTKNNKKGKRKLISGKGIKRLAFLFLGAIAVLGILYSPVFTIQAIEVTEMKQYTKAEICEMIGLSQGQNLFAFSTRKAKEKLLSDPYFKSVTFSRKLPSTIALEIEERQVRGYVPYVGGAYLYIDEYGRVLDVQSYCKEALPIVKGLQFSTFQIGELLDTENPESFDIVVRIAQMMTKYEILDTVVELNVSDPNNITLTANKVQVKLGDISDYDQKIRTMVEVLKTLTPEDMGTLDLSDLSKPIIFKYLT